MSFENENALLRGLGYPPNPSPTVVSFDDENALLRGLGLPPNPPPPTTFPNNALLRAGSLHSPAPATPTVPPPWDKALDGMGLRSIICPETMPPLPPDTRPVSSFPAHGSEQDVALRAGKLHDLRRARYNLWLHHLPVDAVDQEIARLKDPAQPTYAHLAQPAPGRPLPASTQVLALPGPVAAPAAVPAAACSVDWFGEGEGRVVDATTQDAPRPVRPWQRTR